MTDLADLDAAALVRGYRDGAFTPTDVLNAVLARCAAVNPALNAVIFLDEAGARAAADRSTRRWVDARPASALDGVPVTLKDNLHCAGWPTTWGSALFAGTIAPQDEAPVARLRRAGLVFLGKTNVPEFTLQGYTSNAVFGTTVNPLAPGLTPGGSTGGGAAAVAAGIGPIALGTDGGGSLRRPAAHCGLWAFKPSAGQIARHGGLPELLGDFEAVGPVARSAADLAAVVAILAGPDPADPRSLGSGAAAEPIPARPRIGYFPTVGDAPLDPVIRAETDRFAALLSARGCTVVPMAAPFDPARVAAVWGRVAAAGLAGLLSARPGGMDRVGDNARAVAAAGLALSPDEHRDALRDGRAIRHEAAAAFDGFDLLLCPATAALAWPADEPFPPRIDGRDAGPRGHAIFTAWMNVAGLAAATIPLRPTPDRGGIGAQLVARTGQDGPLLAFLMRVSGWIAAAQAGRQGPPGPPTPRTRPQDRGARP